MADKKTDKNMRKLSRAELLELLIAQMEENERLRAQLDEATKKLDSRDIAIQRAGTLAEAAVMINNVFEAADAAAKQYLENVKRISDGENVN